MRFIYVYAEDLYVRACRMWAFTTMTAMTLFGLKPAKGNIADDVWLSLEDATIAVVVDADVDGVVVQAPPNIHYPPMFHPSRQATYIPP